jgi:hypothetical protein
MLGEGFGSDQLDAARKPRHALPAGRVDVHVEALAG